ncbi:MAG: ParA family protein [Clostridia bacterium]|nr:ParA family protein [Clostridia bacterium]
MRKETKIIAFANNKGGSGKSTTCSNIGYVLAESGYNVLMVDADMQQNLSLSFFEEEDVLAFSESGENLFTAIKEERDASSFIRKTKYKNLSLIPSGILMSGAEFELYGKKEGEKTLARVLEGARKSGEYDFILIDSPPTLGMVVLNIMCAADYLLIPIEASPWGLFGLANMLDFFAKTKEQNPALSLLGIAVTKADERKTYFRQTMEFLEELENVNVFKTYIRIDSAVEWAQDNSQPVAAYKKNSRSAKEYAEMAKEMLEYVNR